MAVALVVACAGCARRLPPPGGPPDVEPPRVISSSPAHMSARVPLDAAVEVSFSERVDRRSVIAYLVPLQEESPELDWSGRTLRLKPKEPLSPGTTYVLTIGASARDVHGVAMEQSVSIAFSTGDGVGGGAISGAVRDRLRPAADCAVGAWPIPDTGGVDPDRKRPTYVARTDADGSFTIPYVATGAYRVFAWRDANDNLRADSGLEPLAVCSHDVAIEGDLTYDTLELWLVARPEFPPSIVSVDAPDSSSLVVAFDQPVLARAAARAGAYVLVGAGAPMVAVAWAAPELEQTAVVKARAIGLVPRTEYVLHAARVVDQFGRELDTAGASRTFIASEKADTTAPRVASFGPRAPFIPRTVPAFIAFDEPMDTSAVPPSAAIADSAGAVEARVFWRDPFTVAAVPVVPLRAAEAYRFGLDMREVRDLAGNSPVDSVFAHRFTVTDPGATGEITGRLYSGDSCRVVITAATQAGELALTTDAPGDYVLRGLPGGAITVSAFADLDGDGRWFPGNVLPFKPSEPASVFADTIQVRPRWTVEDVSLWLR